MYLVINMHFFFVYILNYRFVFGCFVGFSWFSSAHYFLRWNRFGVFDIVYRNALLLSFLYNGMPI